VRGLLGSLVANVLLLGIVYLVSSNVPELYRLQDMNITLTLLGIVVLLGVVISGLSTTFAVRKYLSLSADELYY
jgi:cell division transport system permease protein